MTRTEYNETHVRIAVPPGIGDTYWAITKLHDFRRKNRIKHVTLCVKKNPLVRALDWSKMTPLVDATEEFDFEPNKEVKRTGFTRSMPGVDYVMWPNAIIDQGYHLSQWMPKYELDLDFPVTVDPHPGPRDYVVYASSQGVNDNWFPGHGVDFWNKLLEHVYSQTGRVPVLIGAGWDEEFAKGITAPCVNLIGKTSLPEVAAIIKRARVVIGIISGMTILANHFKTPCVAIYPDRFKAGFLTAWIKHGTPYLPLRASEIDDARDVAHFGLKLSN